MNASSLNPAVSVAHPQMMSCTGPAAGKTQPVVNTFKVAERRFGEHFDGSTHAAVIQLMMAILGPTPADMFEQVTPSGNGYDVTMKDEFKVHVTQDELRQAAQASRFSGDDSEAVRAANFALAVFVKRKQQVGDYPGFEVALAKTLQGETTLRCLQGMGVYGLSQSVPPSEMMGEGVVAVMGTRQFGSALVVSGVGYDHGRPCQVGDRYGYRLFADKSRTGAAAHKVLAGQKPKDVWSGFFQGAPGNCVTVSAIKAAMMRFGQSPQTIFRQVTAIPGGYEVVMRDSFSLRLTHEELNQARAASGLAGSDQRLLDDANFLYAVSAKRAQLKNNDFRAGQSYAAALETLNDGEFPGQALRRLGLFGYLRESDVSELAKGAIGTLADGHHSVVVIDGVLDFYGQKHDLASSEWMNTGFRALKLV
ncbi:hypothetical protein C9383_03480 [Pseudomonas palleroniana]|uniref:Uncharacterized protein n=1 Tax=Pseudomonas palleroniana TaxID=191390 RepID=A0A1H5N8F1_9PSED|nr:hypothetical protein F7R03_01205 [Pseudomonas palleroniana]PTC31299.1 hypothetical protein C9383_03480 [Pseudomonas palleroniana]SEE97836.1 hypothetical protein SAMN04490198_4006 [Pseudomonas palleroniana]